MSCIVAILALLVKSRKNLGVADLYTTETLPWESFLIRYLPQYLGAFLTAISQTIVSTLHRTMPYILLASYGNRDKVDITRQALTGYHTYFTPQQFFPYQRPFAIYIFQVIDYFSIFILNSLSTVLFVPGFDKNQSTYRWVMVDLVAIVMVYFMVLQAIALLSITIWLRGRETGLRWDIESIADLIVLIRHSNALMDIQELEKQDVSGRKPSKATERYEPRRLWLGYWKKGNKIVHTIGTKGSNHHSSSRSLANCDMTSRSWARLAAITASTQKSAKHQPSTRPRKKV